MPSPLSLVLFTVAYIAFAVAVGKILKGLRR